MIKYSRPVRISQYSHKIEDMSMISDSKPYISVLSKSNTLSVGSMIKTANKVVKVAPKEDDFLYVRVRAVSAGNVIEQPDGSAELIPMEKLLKNLSMYSKKIRGANDNGDFFSYEELKRTYKTFIGKSAFVDHKNENVENARGIVLDAAWNERCKFVELLVAVDKKAFPELARGVEMGYITDVSMGCRCGTSVCSICGNEAHTEDEFCDHVLKYKGGEFKDQPVFEDNRDIEFFEISFVSQGADKQAKILERVASKTQPTVLPNAEQSNTNSSMLKIASEKNKRFNVSQFKSIKEQLKDLPWT
jgi:hypothetical protein